MRDDLDIYLVLKYPKLFVNRHKGMNESCLYWGFECDDGWFWLINNLCDNIQSYIDNNSKKYRIKNKIARYIFYFINKQRWNSKFIRKQISKFEDKFEKEEYESICQVTVDQVKEKIGGLSFYYSGGNDIIHGMVWLAENMSYNICEICGSTKNIGETKGWTKVICEECSKTSTRLNWKKNEEDQKFLRKVKLNILK